MPSFDPNGPTLEIADEDTPLGQVARTRKQRRMTLLWAINKVWATKDVGAIERWDTDEFHGWVMWPWEDPRG